MQGALALAALAKPFYVKDEASPPIDSNDSRSSDSNI